MKAQTKYMHILVLAAFIFSGISPACAFISGKSWAEICGADGLIKKVEIPEELLAYLPQDEQQQPTHMQNQMDCSFCFASASLTAALPAKTDFVIPAYAGYLPGGAGTYTPLGQDLKPYESQGPPPVFV